MPIRLRAAAAADDDADADARATRPRARRRDERTGRIFTRALERGVDGRRVAESATTRAMDADVGGRPTVRWNIRRNIPDARARVGRQTTTRARTWATVDARGVDARGGWGEMARARTRATSGGDAGARSCDEMDFDLLFAEDEAERSVSVETSEEMEERNREGFDVCAVVVRCARLMCAPRTEEARRALRALRAAALALGDPETFKDDSRRAHVRESGLDKLAETLREVDPVTFGGLERTSSEPPHVDDDVLTKLSHSYLWLPPRAMKCGPTYATVDDRVIIEPNLRSHFVVGRATREYERLVQAIPNCFVGSYAQLTEIVHFVSQHMNASFRERGLDVPPWRRPSALTSKWTLRAPGSSVPPSPCSSPKGPFDEVATTRGGFKQVAFTKPKFIRSTFAFARSSEAQEF